MEEKEKMEKKEEKEEKIEENVEKVEKIEENVEKVEKNEENDEKVEEKNEENVQKEEKVEENDVAEQKEKVEMNEKMEKEVECVENKKEEIENKSSEKDAKEESSEEKVNPDKKGKQDFQNMMEDRPDPINIFRRGFHDFPKSSEKKEANEQEIKNEIDELVKEPRDSKPKEKISKNLSTQIEKEKETKKVVKKKYYPLVDIPREKYSMYENRTTLSIGTGMDTGEYNFIGRTTRVMGDSYLTNPASEQINYEKLEELEKLNHKQKQKKSKFETVDKFYVLTEYKTRYKNVIKGQNRLEFFSIKQNEAIPKDNFSKYIFEQINKIRACPQGYIGVIEDAKDNIIKDKKDRLIYNSKVKVALFSGEEAFNEAIEDLKNIKSMEKLEYSQKLTVFPPKKKEEVKNVNYMKKKVEEMTNNGAYIKSFWKDLVNDPEVCFLMMVVDDNGIKNGMKRNDILDPNMKYIGISSGIVNGRFVCYITLSSSLEK